MQKILNQQTKLFRVLNTNEIIKSYISRRRPFAKSLLSKNIRSSKSRVNSNSSQSQSNTPSSSVSHKRIKAELLHKQSHELLLLNNPVTHT